MNLNLKSSLFINESLSLKNRVVVPPMASGTATKDGFVTTDTINHYERLAGSRASLVMVEYTYISPDGKSEANQLGIDKDEQIDGLKKLSQAIHNQGAASAIQLTHSGAKSSRSLTNGRLISPSGVKVPTKADELEVPDEVSDADIEEIKKSFLRAAKRAHVAGFNIIELHSAHGYGLNQWLSPITNKRTDIYGGSMKNRSRILLEIINLIKAHIPEVIMSVRIPGQDHFMGGLNHEDTSALALNLEKTGVDIINVSSGIGGWRRPRSRYGEGYLVDDAEIISRDLSIPVIGVGGIKTPQYINESLNKSRFSLAAVGRVILNDPTWGLNVGLS